ncbi:hypothetical protein [Caproicibacter sp. BJN0012]|uniref:hypothetical protein n=1 Tax=Caproicibacter sp. BJN0012 TaxID=3110227 RepID=UPI002E128667
MKRKIFMTVLLLSLCLLSLSGCFPSINSDKEVSSTGQTSSISGDQSIPSHITKELDTNLTVDADVNYVAGKTYSVYHAEYKKFDKDLLIQTLLPSDEQIADQKTFLNDIYGEDDTLFISQKQSKLYLSKDFFYFQKPEYDGYSTFITGANDYFLENMSDVYPHKKLPSLDEAAATEKVKTAIDALALPVETDSLQIYTLDAESLNEQAAKFMTNEEYKSMDKTQKTKLKHDFDASDDAYLFVYHCQNNGIPLYFNDNITSSRNGVPLKGARVHALVNKNGLVMLQAYGILDVKSVTQENASIVSPNQALDAVQKKYRNTILANDVKITNISLCYYPCDESSENHSFALSPVWAISVQSTKQTSDAKGKQESLQTKTVIVNATTGQEVQ